MAYHYNFVIISGDTCRADSPEALGVAEVEKPQSGGADCGYTAKKLALNEHGGPYQSSPSNSVRGQMRPKICLANRYGFVIMRGIYDKNVTFLWNSPAMVSSVDRSYMFDISRRYAFGLRARSNIKRGAANCRHGRRSS